MSTAVGSANLGGGGPGGPKPRIHGAGASGVTELELSERQAMVLRSLVAAYVGQAAPVGSGTLTHLVPTRLSPASVRNTLSQLEERGLVAKAHASSGRIPTPLGLQVFVDHLLPPSDLGPHQRRLLDRTLARVDTAETPRQASHLLSEHSQQLGFVVPPRMERFRLRSIHLVGLSRERVLAVLVTEQGAAIQRVVESAEPLEARDLERVGAMLGERALGRTLEELRRSLEAERESLRGEAGGLLQRVWSLGLGACTGGVADDLVVGHHLQLLGQPEFSDPERIRALFAALEDNRRLLDLLRRLAQPDEGEGARVGLAISLGTELGEPGLRECALVAVPYGTPTDPEALGVLGVIGPQRMDYGRVIPLVRYCSELVTRKLLA